MSIYLLFFFVCFCFCIFYGHLPKSHVKKYDKINVNRMRRYTPFYGTKKLEVKTV